MRWLAETQKERPAVVHHALEDDRRRGAVGRHQPATADGHGQALGKPDSPPPPPKVAAFLVHEYGYKSGQVLLTPHELRLNGMHYPTSVPVGGIKSTKGGRSVMPSR